jgi:hypothetical protein
MAGAHKPLFELTLDDRAPIVIVVGYSLVTISIVTVAVRFLHAAHRGIKFGLDDVTYLIGNVRTIFIGSCLSLAAYSRAFVGLSNRQHHFITFDCQPWFGEAHLNSH